MNADQALEQLTEQTAHAVAETLQMFCGEEIKIEGISEVPRGTNPLGAIGMPAVVSNVAYLEGVSGGNLFAITAEGAASALKKQEMMTHFYIGFGEGTMPLRERQGASAPR